MEKTVVFNEADKPLTDEITAYREKRNLSFQDAVKELCQKALAENGNELKWGSF